MLGDGNLGIYNSKWKNRIKKQYRIRITLDSRNLGYTNHIIDLLGSLFSTTPRVYYRKKENGVDVGIFRKDKFFYVVNEIGLKTSPKWNKMEIPIKYRNGKLGLLVLKGLFDTDGCLTVFNNNGTIYPRIEIRLCPSPAQAQVNYILDEFNFKYKIQHHERGKTRVRISGKEQLKKWFELIGSSNPIHIEKSKKFL